MTTTLASVKRAAESAVAAQEKRDRIIREASASGHTIRAIAEAAGLSHGRIHQIARTPWTEADAARITHLRAVPEDGRTTAEDAELRDLRLRESIEVARLRAQAARR